MAPEEQLLALLNRTTRTYGSIDAYLDSIGVGERTRAQIALTLTDEVELERRRAKEDKTV